MDLLNLPESISGLKIKTSKKLAGDASNRSFYRLETKDSSYVLMKDKPFVKEKYPFYLTYLTFRKLGLKVPNIELLVEDEGLVLQEDLGDLLLQNFKEDKEIEQYIFKVLDMISIYQVSTFNKKEDIFPLNIEFTEEKFLEELFLFEKYFFENLTEKEKEILKKDFLEIVKGMINQKFCLQHRDMHSRNIMLKGSDVYFVDFQDARMGPYLYDIASFLIDPYIDFDEKQEEKYLAYYYEKIKNFLNLDFETFLIHYSYNYIQRGLKILGTFSFLVKEKKKKDYLKNIPITVKKLKRHLSCFKKDKEFLNFLWKL